MSAVPDTLFGVVAYDGVNSGADVSDGPVTAAMTVQVDRRQIFLPLILR